MSDQIPPLRPAKPNFTGLPNDYLDHAMPHCTGAEWKIICAIGRQTFGYHKDKDSLSLSELCRLTGLKDSCVKQSISALEERGLVARTKGKNVFTMPIYWLPELGYFLTGLKNGFQSVKNQPGNPVEKQPQQKKPLNKTLNKEEAAPETAAAPLAQNLKSDIRRNLETTHDSIFQPAKNLGGPRKIIRATPTEIATANGWPSRLDSSDEWNEFYRLENWDIQMRSFDKLRAKYKWTEVKARRAELKRRIDSNEKIHHWLAEAIPDPNMVFRLWDKLTEGKDDKTKNMKWSELKAAGLV